jgi:aspartate racemase
MISIIEATVGFILKSNAQEICILATSATINTELYQKKFTDYQIKFTLPEPEIQQQIMQSIYLYKSGDIAKSKDIMINIINLYGFNPARKFLLACTEIPLILEDWIKENPEFFIDATDVLIRNAIEWYQNGQPEIHS